MAPFHDDEPGPTRRRLPAAERRALLLDAAATAFSRSSYRGTTMVLIAEQAQVNPALFYRHFERKQGLFLECLRRAWLDLRATWDDAVAVEADPSQWLLRLGATFLAGATAGRPAVTTLWFVGLPEADHDPEIRDGLRTQLQDVHRYVRDVVARSQAHGGVAADRDASAEAWLFIATGMFLASSDKLGAIDADDLTAILATRRAWLYP